MTRLVADFPDFGTAELNRLVYPVEVHMLAVYCQTTTFRKGFHRKGSRTHNLLTSKARLLADSTNNRLYCSALLTNNKIKSLKGIPAPLFNSQGLPGSGFITAEVDQYFKTFSRRTDQ